MTLYALLAGPCLKISLFVFAGGMLGRVFWYLRGLDWQKDRVAYRTQVRRGLAGAAFSVGAWMAPFAARGSRSQPLATVACWLFHVGFILVALFLSGHEDIRRQAFGWAAFDGISPPLADVLTGLSLLGLCLLALRRALLPEVRFLSTWRDWWVLALCALVLASGALARLQTGTVSNWLLLHMVAAELLMVLAPFTRLSHMVLFFLSRGQLGMDYAVKRGGAKRGAFFPW